MSESNQTFFEKKKYKQSIELQFGYALFIS